MVQLELIDIAHKSYLDVYNLRNNVLRFPLKMDLKDEDLNDEKNQFIFIALEDAQLVACLLLKKINPSILKLRQMAVLPEKQKKGLGSALVNFAEDWARQNNYQKIELHARNHALGFYAKLGYSKCDGEFLEVGIPHFKMIKFIQEDQTV